MLRITCSETGDTRRMLKLEGKLLEPWLDELRTACGAAEIPPSGLHLDLAALSFIDSAGIHGGSSGLIRQGARVYRLAHGFVAEVLNLQHR